MKSITPTPDTPTPDTPTPDTPPPAEPYTLTTKQIAKRLGIRPSTIVRWILAGRLPAARIVGRYRVRESDLQALIQPVAVPRNGQSSADAMTEAQQRREMDRETRAVMQRHGIRLGPEEESWVDQPKNGQGGKKP